VHQGTTNEEELGHTAGLLAAFPPGGPMEAESLEFVADRFDRGDIELQPYPFADDLGLPEQLRHFPAQPLKQIEGRQRTCI